MSEQVVTDLYLTTQRKPLEEVVASRFVRWLLRRIYEHYGFAARDTDGKTYFNIEYRGVFSDPAEARYWANCTGGAVRPIPFNAPLPEATVGYRNFDVPQSEASAEYRRMRMPFVAVPRAERDLFNELAAQIEQTVICSEGTCNKVAE